MLVGNKCVSLYPDDVYLDTSIVFNLRFNLIPSHIARTGDYEELLLFMKSVTNDLRSKMNMIRRADVAKICAFNAYLKLNDSLEEIIMSMNRRNRTEIVQYILHISVHVDFSIKGIENISAIIEETAMLFTSNYFHAQYRLQYPADDKEIPKKNNASLNDEYIKHLDDIDVDVAEYKMLLIGQNDADDGRGILWFDEVDLAPMAGKCDSAFSIQPNPFCLRTELHSKEFEIDVVNRRMTRAHDDDLLSETQHYITFSMLLTTESDESVVVCADEYFSQLHVFEMDDQSDYELEVLSLISFSCSSLSLAVTFVIYCILPELRTLPGLNTMSLVLHLFFEHTFMIVAETADVRVSWLCSAVGVIIHYNLLAGFFWMFVCTLHMLKVFVKIYEKTPSTHTRSIFIKYLVFTESMSAILVACNIVFAIVLLDHSAEFGYGGQLCFLSHHLLIYCFMFAPLFLVLLANIGMFAYVMWRVFHLPDMTDCSNKDRNIVIIFLKLSSLTGITWILGFFSYSRLIRYAFVIFIAGQGIFIMTSFVMNRRVLNMLRSRFRKLKHDKKSGTTRSDFLSVVNGNGNSLQTFRDN